MKVFAALIVVLAATAMASCPNSCSGHGTCAGDDKCTCYARKDGTTDAEGNVVAAWTGPDCSLRTCPFGRAWSDLPWANNNAHRNAECSNAGVCDRKSGSCQCHAGFTGRACDRTACPNSCSGHGTCQSQMRFTTDHAEEAEDDSTAASSIASYTLAWDASKIYGCKCESGFRGPDCSQIECPSGSDPQGGPDGDGYIAGGVSEFRDCSGRGKCDYSSGNCQCFAGFYGEDCSLQSTLV